MKKWVKIVLLSLLGIGFILGTLYMYSWNLYHEKYVPSKNRYTERIAYIEPKNTILSEGFQTCGDYIFDYYNPERATYSKGKNGLRKFILSNYKNNGYRDSGYLNFRFVINCKGKTGRYVIHENDLNLLPKKFNPELREQLLQLTTELKKWNPNIIGGKKVDSYMYISYRIEHGEIKEILP